MGKIKAKQNKKIKFNQAKTKNKKKNKKLIQKPKYNSASLSRKQLQNLSLRERMLEKLKSSRFRYINEEFYTMKGKDAFRYFQKEPAAFKAYHSGYNQQVQVWPMNPLDNIIAALKKQASAGAIIADFGCGEARLSKSLPQFKVHSFDLVALDPCVTVCDVSHTPLDASSVDFVVCCLSLMGTNLADYVKEANRILKDGGILKVAEVESRFEDVNQFLHDVSSFGFKVTWSDFQHQLFYFFDLKKERSIGKRSKKKLPELNLKPCLYKKR